MNPETSTTPFSRTKLSTMPKLDALSEEAEDEVRIFGKINPLYVSLSDIEEAENNRNNNTSNDEHNNNISPELALEQSKSELLHEIRDSLSQRQENLLKQDSYILERQPGSLIMKQQSVESTEFPIVHNFENWQEYGQFTMPKRSNVKVPEEEEDDDDMSAWFETVKASELAKDVNIIGASVPSAFQKNQIDGIANPQLDSKFLSHYLDSARRNKAGATPRADSTPHPSTLQNDNKSGSTRSFKEANDQDGYPLFLYSTQKHSDLQVVNSDFDKEYPPQHQAGGSSSNNHVTFKGVKALRSSWQDDTIEVLPSKPSNEPAVAPEEAPVSTSSWKEKLWRSVSFRKSITEENEADDKGFKLFGRRKSSVSKSKSTVVDESEAQKGESDESGESSRRTSIWKRLSFSKSSQYAHTAQAEDDEPVPEVEQDEDDKNSTPGPWRGFKKRMSRIFRPGRYRSTEDLVAAA